MLDLGSKDRHFETRRRHCVESLRKTHYPLLSTGSTREDRNKAVILLLNFPLFVGVLCLSLFCYALLSVHSSFAIILERKRKLVALLLLSYRCIVTINVLWLFLTVPWVGLQCVIVVFPDHTHLPFLLSVDDRVAA